MHWWQGAFTSKSQSDEDDGGDVTGGIRYCLKPSFFSSRRKRFLSRARKLRQVTESDVDMWRSPRYLQKTSSSSARSSASVASPQPLPLPELHVLLQRDPKFASSCGVPLPSPGEVTKALEDKGRETRDEASTVDAVDGYGHKRLVGHDSRTNAELSEIRSSRKSPQKQNSRNKSSNRYSINIPISCPTSPYSSPALSPYSSPALSPPTSDLWATKYMAPPGVFQVWSAPEMPHSDANPGLDFYYQPHHKRTASSVDNSPLQSPRLSSHFVGTSPPRPASPFNSIISTDIPVAQWESNAQATVHPLPLPPGAVVSSQPGPVSPVGPISDCSSHPASIASHPAKTEYPGANTPPQPSPISAVGNKPEVMPIKSQWRKGKLIGRGTFGSVYVASNRETGALCAMKEVESLPDDSKSAESMRQLEQEIKVLSRLKHPNIVQYYGSETVGDKFYIYLEYVHPGSINKFIHDHCGAITESVVRNFTRHILCGLAYLHSKKTIHRDIKGANLLVDAYGVVKLADFGMAKHLTSQAGQLSLKGSPYWMAPELLQPVTQMDGSSDLALAVDVWSLGCTIIEMMNGNPPWSEYEGAAALFKVLKETPPIPETLSPEGKDFLQCCFRRNPADRPTASKLLDHPFLSHSQQPDASTQGIKVLSDNMQFLRERPSHKKDQVPAPFDTQIKKQGNNEINQRSRLQTPRLAVGSLPSPRSILEPLPILSPPSSRNAPSGRQDADS